MLRFSVLAAAFFVIPATAATLQVGPGRPFRQPSEAAAGAQDGDTVVIDPGEYYDCAVWRRSRLTIIASAPGVVITDRVCEGKALFIVTGDDISITGLTFARARAADRNGAGIRAAGRNLTLRGDRFVNNEVGVLAGDAPDGELRVADCEFTGNGSADPAIPGRALLAGRLRLLGVVRSRFTATRGEEHVVSAAARNEFAGTSIEDAAQGVRLALAAIRAGGTLVLRDNVLRRGANASAQNAAVLVLRGDGPPSQVLGGGNRLVNASGRPMALVQDWSGGTARLYGDTLAAGDRLRSTAGSLRHRAATLVRGAAAQARHLAGLAWRELRAWLR